MGKRKSSSKPQAKKKREGLSSTFQCLFCNHESSVTVKLDKKAGTGDLACKVCGQTFQTGINYLSAAVDVYSDWVDACDAVAKDAADATAKTARTTYRDVDVSSRHQANATSKEEGYGDGDGFIDDDDADAEADYADED
ncbi:hypothetical protein H2203_005658 [Taxawa tesnikishii (nom. ined.)]|nr:hypothetical protein H2203_005658 [Dothideales sp. JES 119]